jgi:hypothetical protein
MAAHRAKWILVLAVILAVAFLLHRILQLVRR